MPSRTKTKTTMTKNELATRVANRSGYTRQQTLDIVEAMMDVMTESFTQGHNITLRGFGTFKVITRKKRRAHDFKNNACVEIPAKRVVKFVPYNDLANTINGK